MLPNFNAPPVTAEDRQRGFAELELELADGTKAAMRVFELSPSEVLQGAVTFPEDFELQLTAKALRVSPEFVRDKISAAGKAQLAAMLAALILGDRAGTAAVANEVRTQLNPTHENH